eukprot:COSAG02_NODE_3147_length_7286_cov_31.918325_3_plen_552_part_00
MSCVKNECSAGLCDAAVMLLVSQLTLSLVAKLALAQTAADDKAALLLFKGGGDPADELVSWHPTDTTNQPCSGWSYDDPTAGWVGVRCTAEDWNNGRVRTLSFTRKSFTGDIGTLTALDALEKLELDGCSGVTGNVHGLATLQALLQVNLAGTGVTGSVEYLAQTQLQHLALGNTAVTGSVETLATCTGLTRLGLEGTAVDGSVAALRELIQLTWLSLENTAVTGSVEALGVSLTRLVNFDLSETSVHGRLTLAGCEGLSTIDLTGCAGVSGSIEWLAGCPSLSTILLSGTTVSGSVEPLGSLDALWTVDLSQGPTISGSVESLVPCTSLRKLDLSGSTGVTGSVSALGGCTALTYLGLTQTSVEGRVEPLSALTQLTVLALTGTDCSGSVDTLAASLGLLTMLSLDGTGVHGNALALRAIDGLGSSWSGFSACSDYTCADDEYGPGERVSEAHTRVGRDDCECCTPPVSFVREEGTAICHPIRDCNGVWSECTVECEDAASRQWTETVSQSGTGEGCPIATDCAPGEDNCPPAINCTGAFSRCSSVSQKR